jgi:NADH-quinone oxidoreductase subunit I
MIWPLIKGLTLTLKYFFSPSVTIQYPEERWEPYPRYRGRHQLYAHEDGRVKCVACMLCATVCPAQCICIVGGLDEEGRQYPKSYEIDLGRCIFCGFCVDACPVRAIGMTTHYELAEDSRTAMVLGKEALMNPPKREA